MEIYCSIFCFEGDTKQTIISTISDYKGGVNAVSNNQYEVVKARHGWLACFF